MSEKEILEKSVAQKKEKIKKEIDHLLSDTSQIANQVLTTAAVALTSYLFVKRLLDNKKGRKNKNNLKDTTHSFIEELPTKIMDTIVTHATPFLLEAIREFLKQYTKRQPPQNQT